MATWPDREAAVAAATQAGDALRKALAPAAAEELVHALEAVGYFLDDGPHGIAEADIPQCIRDCLQLFEGTWSDGTAG